MDTLIAIIMLALYGLGAHFLAVFALNLAGFPGAMIAIRLGRHSDRGFIFGCIVSALGQSLLYLAYAAFIVDRTMVAVRLHKVSIVIWPVAFLAVMLPLWLTVSRARAECQEQGATNAQAAALHLTLRLTLAGFFLFAFFPAIVETIFGRLPPVRP